MVEHVRALHNHIGAGLFDYVIYNSNLSGVGEIKPEWNVTPVTLDEAAAKRIAHVEFIPADVVRADNPLRHDPVKLAERVMALYEERAGKVGVMRGREQERRNGAENGRTAVLSEDEIAGGVGKRGTEV